MSTPRHDKHVRTCTRTTCTSMHTRTFYIDFLAHFFLCALPVSVGKASARSAPQQFCLGLCQDCCQHRSLTWNMFAFDCLICCWHDSIRRHLIIAKTSIFLLRLIVAVRAIKMRKPKVVNKHEVNISSNIDMSPHTSVYVFCKQVCLHVFVVNSSHSCVLNCNCLAMFMV